MAYIRQRGRQLVLAQGQREIDSKKVIQKILFTIYSKGEALEILGKTKSGNQDYFKNLITRKYPKIKFGWEKIMKGIEEGIHILPDIYQYKTEKIIKNFKDDLITFLKQLQVNDPQNSFASNELVNSHRHELEFIREVIDWRLRTASKTTEKDEFNSDNPYYWRLTLSPKGEPHEFEEMAARYFNERKFEKASALFNFLVDSYKDYAEGHNYLGLIALEQNYFDKAEFHFLKTIEIGRKKFPSRIAKSNYWGDLDTRPYMRGLRNLALTLNRMGKFEDALEICERLEKECGDDLTARATKGDAYLNLKMWKKAYKNSRYCSSIHPSCSFVAAFALFEMGEFKESEKYFLHSALNYPRAAFELIGLKNGKFKKPSLRAEIDDHNLLIELEMNIHSYLSNKISLKSFSHFKTFMQNKKIVDQITRRLNAAQNWFGKKDADKKFFNIHNESGQLAYAEKIIASI